MARSGPTPCRSISSSKRRSIWKPGSTFSEALAMDERLLTHYNNELKHLRETAAEFAREFPKIAGRLVLDKDAKESCPDPCIERLLEGFAYLAARVHLKLDAEFPRFTQALLETVYPHYLSPIPSMAVVRFEIDPQQPALLAGVVVPAAPLSRATSAKANARLASFKRPMT